jgi:aminodeoxyfutalosine deaminase
LVGSASAETVLELARRHPDRGVPRTAEELRRFYEFRDFPHFIEVYKAVSGLLSEPEDIADLVRGVARDLAAQQVRYVEMQFGPFAFRRIGMPDAVMTEALDVSARDALAEHGLRIGYIFDFPGQTAGEDAVPTLTHALEHPPEALTGFGIGGIEAGRAPYRDVIRDVFAVAAAAAGHVPRGAATAGRRVADLQRARVVPRRRVEGVAARRDRDRAGRARIAGHSLGVRHMPSARW